MNQHIKFYAVAIFSLFIGSQITEGVLLVPFWQSLSSVKFYSYYAEFGPSIGQFYTILTIVAALIPVIILTTKWLMNAKFCKYALISSIFAILFVSSFYLYFKDTNEMFYQSALSQIELKEELITWSKWHWGRIVIEVLSLVFLIISVSETDSKIKISE